MATASVERSRSDRYDVSPDELRWMRDPTRLAFETTEEVAFTDAMVRIAR